MTDGNALSSHYGALRAVWRGNGDDAPLTGAELSRLSDALLRLQRGLTGERRLVPTDYMQDAALRGAYLLYYWPVSYWQVRCACQFASGHVAGVCHAARDQGRAVRVLDVGCGPAPATCALCDAVLGAGCEASVTLVDKSGRALAAAQDVCLRLYGKRVGVTAIRADISGGADAVVGALLAAGGAGAECPRYDIIVLCHSLNELFCGDAGQIRLRAALLERLCALLCPGGLLLVCEPSLLQTSRDLIAVRDTLVRGGHCVVSPCLQSAVCPVLGEPNRTCHAECAWNPPPEVLAIASKAGLDRQGVKMTFFWFCDRQDAPARGDAPSCYRVVSSPLLNKAGRVRYVLCDGRARITLSAKKGDPHATAQGFFALARYDAITLRSPEPRAAGSYGVTQGTCIQRFGD